MVNHKLRFWMAVALVVSLWGTAGCGNRNAARLSRPPDLAKEAHWAELDNLSRTREGMEILIRTVAYGDFATARHHLTSDDFKRRVAEFENEPIPEKYRTAEREAAKVTAVQVLRQLIADAEANQANSIIKSGDDGAVAALNEFHRIDEP